MKTYNDIFTAVENGKTVIVTNHFGNTRKYFKDENGKIREQFNKCAPHIVRDLKNNSLIESTSKIEII